MEKREEQQINTGKTISDLFEDTRQILAEEKEKYSIRVRHVDNVAKGDIDSDEKYMQVVLDRLHSLLSENYDFPNAKIEEIKNALFYMAELLDRSVSAVGELVGSNADNALWDSTLDALKGIETSLTGLQMYVDFEEMEPYILAELEKPIYEGMELFDLFAESRDERGKVIPGSRYERLIFNAKAAQEAAEKQGRYKPIVRPNSYIISKSKLVNSYLSLQDLLTHIEPDGQYTFLPIEHPDNNQPLRIREQSGKLHEVIDMVSLSYYGDLDGKAAKIKGYDQSIYNGICSLVYAGNNTFLLEDLYKVITQKQRSTEAQEQLIENSLAKFGATRIKLDVTEEIKYNLLADNDRIKQGIIDEALLNYRIFTVVTEKGTVKKAVEILGAPVLLWYSMEKKQIITIPVELLEIERATPEIIAMRDYLLREINQMIKGFRNNQNIRYDSILKHIGKNDEKISGTQKSRLIESACNILDNLKDKKYISGYTIRNGAHNTINSIEIKL